MTRDSTRIYYRDWSRGQPVLFAHGWPLSADAWDSQMMFMGSKGYRVIAHDRRGHGRSEQTWTGNDMDTYADDLAQLIVALDLRDLILVGHSTGGGEVVRYLGRHGCDRVAKVVLASAVVPSLVRTPSNPGGLDIAQFDQLRSEVLDDRAELWRGLAPVFYATDRPGAEPREGLRHSFWRQGMLGGIKPIYDCIAAFSQTDFSDDLARIDVPTLFIHGDDDRIVPLAGSAKVAVKMMANASLKVYAGAPHGLPQTHSDRFNADLLAFAQQ